MHEIVRVVLLQALNDERSAFASDKRAAYRLTRFLIAGVLSNGVSAATVAELAGMTADAVRLRGSQDGPIPRSVACQWVGATVFSSLVASPAIGSRPYILASALVRALMAHEGGQIV